MSKTRDTGFLGNVVKVDTSGNVSFVSGSTTLATINTSGQLSGSSPVLSSSYALNADLLDGLDSTQFTLTSSFAAQTASFTAFTSSILTYTSSANSRFSSIETVTGSNITRLSALEAATGSLYSYTSSLNNKTSSFATTGSNTFEGIQTINSNLVVTGSITAQTLVVQTITSSVDFVTGSTRFGSLLGNTHVFSGSVTMNPGGLFVSSSGNVGINTIDPSSKLHVVGSSLTDTFRITDASNYTIVMGYSGSANVGMISTLGGTAKLALGTNSAARLTIDGTGNVGIGTTTPVALDSGGVNLQIKDRSALFQLAAVNSTYLSNNIYYDGSWKRIVSGYGALIRLNDDSNGFSFLTTGTGGANSAVTFTSAMTITNAGNVGIGTSSPSYKLDVANTDAQMSLTATAAAGYNEIYFRRNTSTIISYIGVGVNSTVTAAGDDFVLQNSISGGNIVFRTNRSGTIAERIRITSDGAFKCSAGGGTLRDATGAVPEISQAVNVHCLVMSQKTSEFSQSGFGVFGIAVDKANNSDYSFAGWYSSTTSDKEFNFRGDGLGYSDSGWTTPASDYAEYFESLDGTALPVGKTVVLENGKVRLATLEDTNIIGVIRPKNVALFLGNNESEKWNQKYLKDDYGAYIRNEKNERILNPNYDESMIYVPREERAEWNIVGLVGQVPINKGQPTNTNWVKMKDISDTVEEWLIK